MVAGTIRYWAAAKAAAGVPEEPFEAETLAEVLRWARATRDDRFAAVLDTSSLLVDGTPVTTRAAAEVRLVAGCVIEVLPPFAGG